MCIVLVTLCLQKCPMFQIRAVFQRDVLFKTLSVDMRPDLENTLHFCSYASDRLYT